MNDLKRCPFCDGEADVFNDVSFNVRSGKMIGKIKFFVWCTECTALVSGNTKEGTIEAWNRRVSNGS